MKTPCSERTPCWTLHTSSPKYPLYFNLLMSMLPCLIAHSIDNRLAFEISTVPNLTRLQLFAIGVRWAHNSCSSRFDSARAALQFLALAAYFCLFMIITFARTFGPISPAVGTFEMADMFSLSLSLPWLALKLHVGERDSNSCRLRKFGARATRIQILGPAPSWTTDAHAKRKRLRPLRKLYPNLSTRKNIIKELKTLSCYTPPKELA